MSTKKIGIVAGIVFALSVVVSPAMAACSLSDLASCDNNGLMALVLQLLAGQQTQTTTTTGASYAGIPAGFQFTANLKQGQTSNDVKYLQILLNADSATSIGNAGKETTYFGSMTKAAVVKFQNKYASEVLTPYGLTTGTGFFGTSTRAKANALLQAGTTTGTTGTTGTTTTTPTTTGFTVSLAADTPAAGTLITGAAIADIAHFTFSNGTSSPVTITNLKMNRLGVSADATLAKLYLYDGNTRLSDEATASTGVFSWNNSTGVIVIPANTVKTIAVKANIATGTSGQTVGVGIVAADSITGATATGTFPVNANIHTIAQAILAGVSFSSTVTPALNNSLTPQNNFIMFEDTVTIGTRAVYLKSITFRNIGSVAQSDLQNFKLLIDGTQVGSTVVSQGTDGYFTFDMSSAPIKLETGSRIFKVVGDVIGGSTRTFKVSLYKASDVQVTDSEYNGNILVQRDSGTFSPVEAGQQTVATGDLTITKRTDSTSGNIAKGASQLTLAKYDLKATGEAIKIENLRVNIDSSDNNVGELRNGALFVDGVQVGSTASLEEVDGVGNDTDALTYTEYSLGSALVVTPGTTKVLEVRADIYDADGTDSTSAGDTIKVNLVVGSTNAQRMTSGGYFNTPANTDANTLQIASGTLSSTVDQSYGSSSVVVPQTNFLLGKFSVTAGSTENINLNTVKVLFKFSASDFASADLTNVYVKYGAEQTTALSAIATAAAGADSLNTFSISKTINKTQSITFEVYGDIASSAYSDATADTVQTYLQVSGTTAQSGTTVYSRGAAGMTADDEDTTGSAGQTITAAGSGNLTVSLDNSTPLAAQVVAGATPDAGSLKIKMTAANGDLYVKRVDLRIDTVADTEAISSVDLYAAQGSGTYTKVGETQVVNYDGTNPGYVQWILGGDARVQVLKSGTTYLLAKPTYVSSGQTDISGDTPQLVLVDLEADGANGTTIVPGFTTATNNSGIIILSNGSGLYADSSATTTAANTTSTATTIVTNNGANFTPGDVIFIDEDGGNDYDAATEELMVVLVDGGANLTVQRGAFGTTAYAYAEDSVKIFRLNTSGTVRGIIGNAQTVLNTKVTLSLGSDSPSGATTGATGKVVFTFNAAAENNATDPAENKAVLTRIDITTSKSAATVNGLTLYPSEFDNNSTYATACSGLSATKWRCVMNTTGGSNEVIENTSRKYIARADVGYSNAGNLAVSINNLGTVDTALNTNDVLWTDGTTAQDWVNQATTSVQGGSQTTTAASGTADTTAPTISSIVVANKSAGVADTIENGDIITVTFSEIIDPTTINATLVPGGDAVTGVAAASTGGVTGVQADGIITITNITTFDSGASLAGAVSHTTNLALDSTGKILTITLNTGTSRAITTPALGAGTTATTVKDINAVAMAAVASPVPTGAF